jgi:hypothetical protein
LDVTQHFLAVQIIHIRTEKHQPQVFVVAQLVLIKFAVLSITQLAEEPVATQLQFPTAVLLEKLDTLEQQAAIQLHTPLLIIIHALVVEPQMV